MFIEKTDLVLNLQGVEAPASFYESRYEKGEEALWPRRPHDSWISLSSSDPRVQQFFGDWLDEYHSTKMVGEGFPGEKTLEGRAGESRVVIHNCTPRFLGPFQEESQTDQESLESLKNCRKYRIDFRYWEIS